MMGSIKLAGTPRGGVRRFSLSNVAEQFADAAARRSYLWIR